MGYGEGIKDSLLPYRCNKEEINLIFEMIEKYADDYSKDELLGVLKHISSDLYLYLQNYDYKHELLNDYFSDYKYLKVTNKITD